MERCKKWKKWKKWARNGIHRGGPDCVVSTVTGDCVCLCVTVCTPSSLRLLERLGTVPHPLACAATAAAAAPPPPLPPRLLMNNLPPFPLSPSSSTNPSCFSVYSLSLSLHASPLLAVSLSTRSPSTPPIPRSTSHLSITPFIRST